MKTNKIKIVQLFFFFFLFCTTSFSQIKFVCIGNSISHGKYTAATLYKNTSIGDSLKEMSYRFWFWEKLDSAGINATMVGYNTKYFTQWGIVIDQKSRYTGHAFVNKHEAYYGIRTDGFLAGGWSNDGFTAPTFDERLQGYTPDVALMHIGYNDDESFVNNTEANIKSIIQKLRNKNPNITILLAKQIVAKAIDARNAKIVSETTTANSIVYSVDMTTGFISNPGAAGTMTLDWIHPNVKGQKHMAQRWYDAYMKITQADASAPTVPSAPTASNIKSTSVDLTWTGSTDNIGVNAYNVYANDVLVGSTGLLKFTASGLTPNTAYVFKITAVDFKKNESAKSAGANATTGVNTTFAMTFSVNDGSYPVKDVNVTFGATTIKTNTSGNAVFSGVTAGTINYTISKTGWKSQTGSINLTKDSTKVFTLAPNCSLTVIVKEGTSPLSAAEVTVHNVKKTTDALGKVLYTELTPGITMTYSVKKTGYDDFGPANIILKGDSTFTILMTKMVQIALNNDIEKITIYPIPASGQITIANAEGMMVEIVDLSGSKMITTFVKSNSETIDVSCLAEGLYLVNVCKDNIHFTQKIQIRRDK